MQIFPGLLAACAFLVPAVSFAASAATPATSGSAAAPRVEIETSLGDIVVALDPVRAPRTVANFLAYVKSGFYDGTIFHRVVAGFVIQGGGFTPALQEKPTRPPIADEAANGLANLRGTIAMARKRDPDSATSQFYINLADNPMLDFRFPGNPGYAVFGHVVAGMDVVERIAKQPTGAGGPFPANVPAKPVVIEKTELLAP